MAIKIAGTTVIDDDRNITTNAGTVHGRNMATDGAKLDGIATGATANQTAAEILTAIKTVDGSTSGLDADLLDGKHASSFIQNAVTYSSSYSADSNDIDGIAFLRIQGGDNKAFSGHHNLLQIPNSGSAQYDVQLAIETDSDPQFKFRSGYGGANDSWSAWRQIWHDGNDGANSGLDADLLDGQHGSYYTGYTDTAISNLVDSSPGTLNTLNELAAALGDDASFSTTVTNSIATKLPLSGGTMTGSLTIDTGSNSSDALVIRGETPTISFIDQTSGADDFYIHINNHNFYVLRDTAGANLVGTGWDNPHPLSLEGDTNIGYVFGSRMFHETYHPNADKWTTARTLTLTGDVTGSVSWDGSGNASITTAVADNSHNHDHSDGDFTVNGGNLFIGNSQQRVKLSVWSDTNYGIGMKSGYTFGALNNDYAMSFQMNDDLDRGFWWGDTTHTDAQGAMSLTTDGVLTVANNIAVGFGESDTTRRTTYDLDVNGTARVTTDLYVGDQIIHDGDNDTYMQFHAVDQWRVVTGGTERFEVNNSAVTSLEPLYVPDIYLNGNVYHNGDTNTYMGFHNNDQWRVVTGGGERLEINSDNAILATNLQINSHNIDMDLNNVGINAIDMEDVRISTWPLNFTTNAVGNDNESGFWVASNGYPDMRLRRENSTVRAKISSWEESYVSNGFRVEGDTDLNGNVRVDRQDTISTTTPGIKATYGMHFGGLLTSTRATGITFGADTSSGNTAQAGLYVQGSGSYGTKMYLATTDSYSTGAKTAISIDHLGKADFARQTPTVSGNTVWHAGNDGAGSGLDADLLDGIDSSRVVYGGNTTKTTNTSSASGKQPSGFYDQHQGDMPTSTYYSYLNMRHTNTGNHHGAQLAVSFYSPDLYTRNYSGGSASSNGNFSAWSKMWSNTNDGSGSGLDADLLDGVQGSSYLRSDADDTFTGNLTLSKDGQDVLNFSANDTNDARGISFNNRTALSADYNDGYLRLNQLSEFTNGIYTPGVLRVDGNLEVATNIVHQGDSNTYLQFESDTFNVYVGGSREVTVNASGVRLGDTGNGYFQPVTGNYGSIQIDSGAHSGWEGYSIGGRAVFMHDNASTTGLYNDVDNEWLFRSVHNGASYLYHNGFVALETVGNTGIKVGSTSSSDIYMTDSNEGERRIHCNSNKIGFLNSSNGWGSYCDDAGNWFSDFSVRSPNFYVDSAIYHNGDTNTYMQFHAADQWRVVTGGAERLEVNNSQITSTEPVHAPSFHGDGSSLTGIAAGAGGGGNDEIFWENGQSVTSNYTITNGKNAMSAGPITINSGVTVTVGAGETWTVI